MERSGESDEQRKDEKEGGADVLPLSLIIHTFVCNACYAG